MSGYFDPYAEAQMNGFAHGRIDGEQEGRTDGMREGRAKGYKAGEQDGYDIGFIDGQAAGYDAGWNDAIARANQEIRKQMEFTQKHVADKEKLAQQLEEQRKLIDLLTEKVDAMEKENAALKQSNQGLRDVITALKAANEQLQTEVAQLDEKVKQRTQEYNDHLWQYNRCAVFMNSVRSVLEDLTTEDGPHADHVRGLFAKRYGEHIESALKKGTIRAPLDQDEALGKAMPKTQKFIQDMLSAVARHAPDKIRDNFSAFTESAANDNSPSM